MLEKSMRNKAITYYKKSCIISKQYYKKRALFKQKKKRLTSPKILWIFCKLTYILIIGTKNLSSNPSKARPVHCIIQQSHSIWECRILHRVHVAEALPTLRDRYLEIPSFEKQPCSPVKMIPENFHIDLIGIKQVARTERTHNNILYISLFF